MASIRALAVRQGEIGNTLAALAERVQARLAGPPPAPVYAKDPAIARLQRLEYLAAVIAALLEEQPAAAAEAALAETTAIAADLFTQVQEAQADDDEVRPAAPREREPSLAPAPTAARPGPAQARAGRR